ncbi:polyprenol monophosphomannose synthase [Blastococcus haudaquaticus]|uniref:Dolichol-phosphate mannosyltransferase n=1 Tax=Blastococcus haudaquaticus TaxID=1938745 RepID=A0A286GPF1_9ACTN|nr:polyprenol monophosphomannose synthase [Blastococcus haudaquaticus]SOD97413.1 dolichol-phosphate mannosyltransferase [Blastococcus haudaquaticus]
MTDRVLVVVPTFNEVENLEAILDRLHASVPEAHALVVDDGSPDGTGELAEKLAAADDRVHVLRRTAKLGLGRAYVAGFAWGRERGYDVLVEMDADGSHAPEQLPDLLAALGTADLALGSRYVPGGAVTDWPAHRLLLSRMGNRYTRWALRLPLSDATGGYRAARAELIDRLPFGDVASQGYCFQVDWAWRAVRAGATVVEVPITFTERAFGRSKMSGWIVREALVRVTVWGLRDRLADWLPGRVRRPVPARAGRREAEQHE